MSKIKSLLKLGTAFGAGYATGKYQTNNKKDQGFIAGLSKMHPGIEHAMAADATKSTARKVGESFGLGRFIRAINHLSALPEYNNFWDSWDQMTRDDRIDKLVESVGKNADPAMNVDGNDDMEIFLKNARKNFEGHPGIEKVERPKLSIYEDPVRALAYQHDPETQGFYEMHRFLVGHIAACSDENISDVYG